MIHIPNLFANIRLDFITGLYFIIGLYFTIGLQSESQLLQVFVSRITYTMNLHNLFVFMMHIHNLFALRINIGLYFITGLYFIIGLQSESQPLIFLLHSILAYY